MNVVHYRFQDNVRDPYKFTFYLLTLLTVAPHRLHNLTAVPRSTQPSPLHRMLKRVSAFRLHND